jgi:hypothetical protein
MITLEMAIAKIKQLSCYTAKLYNPNILNSCLTGKMPVPLIQIKWTTAYPYLAIIQLIDIEPEIAEIVQTYIQNQVMPNDPLWSPSCHSILS